MKMHSTLVDKLLKIYEINSGWKEEWKLKQALQDINLTVYTQRDGNQILVDTEQHQNASGVKK